MGWLGTTDTEPLLVLEASDSASRAAVPPRREGRLLPASSRPGDPGALGLVATSPQPLLDGHMDPSAVSRLPLPPYQDAGTAFACHPNNLLIAKSLTCSHLRHLSLDGHMRVPSLGPAVGAPVAPCVPPSTWQTRRALVDSADGDGAQGGVSGGEVHRA